MRANRGHCTCKGYWDECAYCRSLEDQSTPEPEPAEEPVSEALASIVRRRMPDVERVATHPPEEPWLPGDVVLDAGGRVWIRSHHPRWVWDYPDEGRTDIHRDGSVEEENHAVVRPLTLLARGGRAVNSVTVEADE